MRPWKLAALFPILLSGFGLGLLLLAGVQYAGLAAIPTASVSGKILRLDGAPAAGAWVRQQATDNLTYAAADGSFTLDGLSPGVTATLTAWIPDYKVGWAVIVPPALPITITLSPYPTGDNPAYAWNTSYPDPANPVLGCGHCMRPSFDEWQHTAHAASATNPRFFSLYNGTDLSGNLSVPPGYLLDFPGTAGNCAACHAPGAAYDAPFSTDMNALAGIAGEGVFCEYCHKVGDVYLNPATARPYDNAPGVLSTRLYRPFPPDQLFFGSLDDVNRRVSYLPLEKSSAFCAPCHQFSFWGTPIYQSYREWQESPYPAQGIECQTCHMPPGEDPYFVLPEKGGLARDPMRLASHKDLGLKDTAFMTGTLAMTVTWQSFGDALAVDVALTNLGAGHHVPTDHPGRQLILTVSARAGDGSSLTPIGGERVPAWGGAQAGLPGKAYAKVLQDVVSGDYPVVSYWKQTRILSDNRIPATGSDLSSYLFRLPPGVQVAQVTVELRFRRSFQAEMDARAWDEPDILLARQDQTLNLPPFHRVLAPLITR